MVNINHLESANETHNNILPHTCYFIPEMKITSTTTAAAKNRKEKVWQ